MTSERVCPCYKYVGTYRCGMAVYRQPIYIDRDTIPRVLSVLITRGNETSRESEQVL